MNIQLPWKDSILDLKVPDTWTLVFPEPARVTVRQEKSEVTIVDAAMKKPVGTKPIHMSQLANKKIVIVVDDNTRPTPAYRFFHLILDALKAAGVTLDNIVIISALGIHTPMTETDMAGKIGEENQAALRWENHNAFDDTANAFFGETSRGTPVYLNRHLKTADYIVLVGLIEPHLMAGFGGGLKNILPGLASAETIGKHHEILSEPPYRANRVGMPPDYNSFRRDLEEVKEMIDAEVFCINVVLDKAHTITACFTGDPVQAHRQGVAYNAANFGLNLSARVDGIITNAFPMTTNFKQSMKCVGNALPALKPGGAVMGFLQADKGMDDIAMPESSPLPLGMVKMILRLIGPSRVYGFLNRVKKNVDIEEKFLYYYTLQLIRQYDVYLYVPTLTPEEIKALFFFKGFTSDPQAVIQQGIRKIGKRATVAVFPEGGATFPVLKNE
ncbi:MAG: nickel-dependent lactate racemase [Thermodesulfobacteriota bacterium]|nr:nickel-dependent lactate racemase [Thermodesulfobacteriota bacterium]